MKKIITIVVVFCAIFIIAPIVSAEPSNGNSIQYHRPRPPMPHPYPIRPVPQFHRPLPHYPYRPIPHYPYRPIPYEYRRPVPYYYRDNSMTDYEKAKLLLKLLEIVGNQNSN